MKLATINQSSTTSSHKNGPRRGRSDGIRTDSTAPGRRSMDAKNCVQLHFNLSKLDPETDIEQILQNYFDSGANVSRRRRHSDREGDRGGHGRVVDGHDGRRLVENSKSYLRSSRSIFFKMIQPRPLLFLPF